MTIRWLDQLTRDDVALAGGKGANLGELLRAGFRVPNGFVVTTDAYRGFVAENGLGEAIAALAAEGGADASARIAGLFAGAELSQEVAAEIRSAYGTHLGGGPVAVRSSATAEDLAEASFAGQQDTYLNVVGEDDVLAAVRDCWASLWTDRAIRYRAEHLPDPAAADPEAADTLALAVVVQKLVPAEAAGVMFTANPADGRTEETVITAAWGLGEAVVSGLVDADTVVVDTDTGRVLDHKVADKAVRIDPGTAASGGRTTTSETPEHQRRARVLDDADALRLAGLGSAIERHFGAPQDIEWVLSGGEFSIVQARPITALPERTGPVPTEWPIPEPGLYFRASITEQLPDPLTPLFAGLMATAVPGGLQRLFAELSPDLSLDDVSFPTINGYAFYRYGYPAFGAMLKSSPAALTMIGSSGGAWVEERWRARLEEYRTEVAAEDAPAPAALSAAALLAAVGRLVDAMAYYYTSVQTIIPVAAMAELTWNGVYDKLLRAPAGPPAETFLLGFDSEPLRAEKALYDLSRWVLEQPGLPAVLADRTVDAASDEPPAGVGAETWSQWRERFAAHLAEHGHTLYNLDVVTPVPADDPTPVVQALRFDLEPDTPDPYARQRRAAAAREDASARLLTRLGGWRADRARTLLLRAQHTAPLREDALAAMGLYAPVARRLLRELGGRLVAAGLLDEPFDVCWLTLPEARQLAAALDGAAAVEENGGLPSDLRDRVAGRREVARGQRLATPPQYLPKSRVMDAFGWMYPAQEGQSGDELKGNVGSGGVVTARARVLTGPEDFASFRPGEVLVASITTPAYTPLFAMAAGVVTDIGGVLSHGSIVAREYGIPAVLGTGSATRVIRTGDEITVDGATGRVRLPGAAAVEPPAAAPDRVTWLVVSGGLALAATAVAVWYRRRRR
jgi:pyruvate,water dikinase